MKQKVNVHSINMLPLYLEMSQGQFSSSFEQLQHFEACKERPSVLDDDIVNRTIKLHEEQKEYNLLTLEQCRRWRLQRPSDEELEDIEIVETYIKKLQQVNKQILFLAYHYKDHTIDRILEKEDGELAIDFMMGNLYDPCGTVKEITPFGPGSSGSVVFPVVQEVSVYKGLIKFFKQSKNGFSSKIIHEKCYL